MKKMLAFIFLLSCISSTVLFKDLSNPIWKIDGIDKFCFVSEKGRLSESAEVVLCGDLTFNYCSFELAKENFDALKKQSENYQVYFDSIDVDSFLETMKAEVLRINQYEDLFVYDCYTPFENDFYCIDNKKINMQVACIEEKIVAGFPIILTGY